MTVRVWREIMHAHVGHDDDHAAELSNYSTAVLDAACNLVAAPKEHLFEMLERTEAACAELRLWLKRNGRS